MVRGVNEGRRTGERHVLRRVTGKACRVLCFYSITHAVSVMACVMQRGGAGREREDDKSRRKGGRITNGGRREMGEK